MRMQFDSHDAKDEPEAGAVREQLVEQFATWLGTRPDHAEADPWDADLLLHWKFSYADGDYGWWTRHHVDEVLLEHLPRKLSASPSEAASVPASVGAFVAFLDDRSLLSANSDPVGAIAARAAAQARAFLDAMADPGTFGMAKRLFSSIGFDPAEEHDQATLDRAMAEFNALSFEERGRILGLDDGDGLVDIDDAPFLPLRSAPAETELDALASGVVLVQRVDALHAALTAAGADLDDGLPAPADRGRLADAVGVAPGGHDLDAAIDLAIEAEAAERTDGRLLPVKEWAGESPADRWREVVDAALELGASSLRFGEPDEATDLVAVADEAAPMFLALLWIAEEAIPDEVLVEALAEGSRHQPDTAGLRGLDDDRRMSVCRQRVDEVLTTFVELGLVTRADGGTTLTDAGAWAASLTLAEFGCDVVLPEDVATMTADEVLGLVIERDDDVGVAVELWARDRRASDAADEVVASLLADPDTVRIALGFTMLERLGPAARAAVEAARDTVLAPHAWLWLAATGVIDHDEVPKEMAMQAGVDVLLATADLGSPADLIEALLEQQPLEHHERLLDDLAASGHPRVGDLLELVGRHHPAKRVGKHARTLAHRWRSRHGRR